MASNTIRQLVKPTAMSATYTTNIYNVPTSSGGVGAGLTPYAIIRHIHVANKTGSAATFRLYIGATGGNTAGTELFFDQSVAANSSFDFYGQIRMDAADFLVGGASAGTTLTIAISGEVGA
jgi:Tfp pilus assembly protein PilX